jgi:AmiR/NasT family two-component response regulator
MAEAQDARDGGETVLIFENDPKQADAYAQLFQARGFRPVLALPSQDVQALCERLKPSLVVFDMGFWEADAAYVLGIVTMSMGFERPVILALASLPHQVRRAKRFGADAVWIRGVDDAAGLPQVADDLLKSRRDGKLKSRIPSTPL